MERIAHYAARLAGIVAMGGLLGIALLVSADVLLRWLLSAPVHGAEDIVDALLPMVVAATFASAAIGRKHISIGLAKAFLGARGGRFFDRLGDASVAIFFAILVWQFWNYSASIADEGRQTWVLGLKLAPFWYATTALLALCGLIQIWACFAPGGGTQGREEGELH